MNPATRALVVEDDPQMARFLRATLTAHELVVTVAGTIALGRTAAAADPPDIVLLDLGLPDGDGLELVRALRTWTAVPIIVLSARGREDDKVAALDAGADDYLSKPFSTSELLARIRVALRHVAQRTPIREQVVELGAVRVDLARRVVTRAGQPVHLTPHEYKLLEVLLRHADRVVTHRQLLREVWGVAHGAEIRYLRVYMTTLRQKLGEQPGRPRWLTTEPGVGYRLRLDSELAGG